MKAHVLIIRIAASILALCFLSTVEAGSPVWTFTPLTSTTLTVAPSETATVQYTLTNQSNKQHILSFSNIPGISQNSTAGNCSNPATLNGQESCTLTLTVTGSDMSGNIQSGPVVCEQGSTLQCYQPSPADRLNISLTNVTPVVGEGAYITNQVDTVSRCLVDVTSGELSDCAEAVSGQNFPRGIALSNDSAYITNVTTDSIERCTINTSTGALGPCTSTGNGLNAPYGVALNNNFGYVVNNNAPSTVSLCDINAGDFINCSLTGSGFDRPIDIAFSNGFSYITNNNGSTVSRCDVNPTTGVLSNCASTGSGFSAPFGIALHNGFAYVVNQSTTVSRCDVNPTTGALSNCASTGSGFNAPRYIAIKYGFAYITNITTSSVTKCTINDADGELSNCASTGSGFNAPYGIAFTG